MESTVLVIENSSTDIAKQLNCSKLSFNNQSKDNDIHAWLIENRSYLLGKKKIIIPCRLGTDDAEFMGIYVGLHLRLTKELEDARFLPIAFVSESSKDDILQNQVDNNKLKSSLLLFTQGSFLLSSFDLDKYIRASIPTLNDESLREDVLPNLLIENSIDSGHRLANEWGAFRLAKFAGLSLSINKPSSLFFKYKDALTNNEIIPSVNNKIGLVKESCKALLIDDNAAVGWEEVLKFILRNKVTDPSKTIQLDIIQEYEQALSFTDYDNYNVVFLDLRLLKVEDKPNKIIDIDDYSGTKILKKIIGINRGIQIIIFTASNKIWNIEKLLHLGASGYYIKESPEYTLSSKFSEDNYNMLVNTIKACLSRKPLKLIYQLSSEIESTLGTLSANNKLDSSCATSLQKYITLSYKIIEKASVPNDFGMGYLILFKCIELINDYYVYQNTAASWCIKGYGPLKKYVFDSKMQSYNEETPTNFYNNIPTTFEKISAISIQVLDLPNDEINKLYYNVLRRNKFIHPDNGTSLSNNQKREVELIYTYDGYIKLTSSLNLLVSKLYEKL